MLVGTVIVWKFGIPSAIAAASKLCSTVLRFSFDKKYRYELLMVVNEVPTIFDDVPTAVALFSPLQSSSVP